MNIRFLAIISMCILFCSCIKTEETNEAANTKQTGSQDITATDISKLDYAEFVLDPKATKITDNWEIYNEFKEQVAFIKAADLSYLNYDKKEIESFFKGFKEHIPEPLNTNAIIARITVIETKLFQIENLTKLSTTTKEELIAGIKAYLIAASNLDFQINKIIEKESQEIQKP